MGFLPKSESGIGKTWFTASVSYLSWSVHVATLSPADKPKLAHHRAGPSPRPRPYQNGFLAPPWAFPVWGRSRHWTLVALTLSHFTTGNPDFSFGVSWILTLPYFTSFSFLSFIASLQTSTSSLSPLGILCFRLSFLLFSLEQFSLLLDFGGDIRLYRPKGCHCRMPSTSFTSVDCLTPTQQTERHLLRRHQGQEERQHVRLP